VSTEYVDVDGSAIGYRTIGSGTPLVLLNRMRGTLDTWDPLFLDELAQAQRVVVVDYPGTGYSAGALPGDLGQVAQALLLQHPEAVSHAVLVGTTPPGPGQAEIQKVWLERALKPVNDLDDEIVLFFEPASEASGRAAARSHERIYARPDVVSKIPARQEEFQAFLCGDNDTSVPAANWYPLIGRIPRAQLIVLPESGHGPQHQYPELSARYVTAFLAEIPH